MWEILQLLEQFLRFSNVLADDGSINFNLIDRKGQIGERFSMRPKVLEFKGINVVTVTDPDTNLPIFATTKQTYNMEKSPRNLEAKAVYAAEVVSPVDTKLKVDTERNIFVLGIEGTKIDGKEIAMSADQNIFLKSSNGSITMHSANGIYFDIDRIPIVPDADYSQVRNDLQYKLCLCYPKGALYRVPLSKMHGVADPCRHFDRRTFNPC